MLVDILGWEFVFFFDVKGWVNGCLLIYWLKFESGVLLMFMCIVIKVMDYLLV